MTTATQTTGTEMVEVGMLLTISNRGSIFTGYSHEHSYEKSRAVMNDVVTLFGEELTRCGITDVQPRTLMYLESDSRFWRVAVLMDMRREQLTALQQGPVGDHVQEVKPYEEFPESPPMTISDASVALDPFMERLTSILKAHAEE